MAYNYFTQNQLLDYIDWDKVTKLSDDDLKIIEK